MKKLVFAVLLSIISFSIFAKEVTISEVRKNALNIVKNMSCDDFKQVNKTMLSKTTDEEILSEVKKRNPAVKMTPAQFREISKTMLETLSCEQIKEATYKSIKVASNKELKEFLEISSSSN